MERVDGKDRSTGTVVKMFQKKTKNKELIHVGVFPYTMANI
jgi:hypothetical protein